MEHQVEQIAGGIALVRRLGVEQPSELASRLLHQPLFPIFASNHSDLTIFPVF
jgi:hypothetical protein